MDLFGNPCGKQRFLIGRCGAPALLLLLFLVLSLSTTLKPAEAQEMEIIAGVELEYQNNCAVCHGVNAKRAGAYEQVFNRSAERPNSNSEKEWRRISVLAGLPDD